MKDKKKWRDNFFLFSFLVLFMAFTTLYISGNAGYYEYSQYKKKTFTEEQIKKFEQDVNSGKKVDIEDYLTIDENFQDKKERIGAKVSRLIGDYTKLGVNKIFKMLNNFVEN